MNPIRVTIDELILDGFDPADRHRIAAALERELSRILVSEGLPAQGLETARLDGGQFDFPATAKAETIGAAIAQNVHGALNHGR